MSTTETILSKRSRGLVPLAGVALVGAVLMLAGCASRGPAPGPGSGAVSTPAQTHTVVPGDTVYGISRRYGVPMKEIIAVNGLTPPFTLRIGQVLRLPGQAVHVVQRGDTVYSIARLYGVDMNRLARENALGSDYMIQVGQTLTLPGAETSSPPQAAPLSSTQVAMAPVPVQKPLAETDGGGGTRVGDRVVVPPPVKPVTSSPPAVTARGMPLPPTTKKPTPVVARAPVPDAPARTGPFSWPVQGRVLSKFGPTHGGQHNDGINIAAQAGTPVTAAESGVVVYAGNEVRGFGNLILVKHQGGLMTAYAHNEVLLVGRGATVSRGQTIARVGDTGGVSEPQLHFEIRKNGKAIDPAPYLTGQRIAMR